MKMAIEHAGPLERTVKDRRLFSRGTPVDDGVAEILGSSVLVLADGRVRALARISDGLAVIEGRLREART